MYTPDNTPRYSQKVMHGENEVTVECFMGVIADALYGSRDAWATVRSEGGQSYMCSLYELSPCKS